MRSKKTTKFYWTLTTIGDARSESEKTYLTVVEDISKLKIRTVGIFMSEEDAEECIMKNYGHLDECGWYSWAIIEKNPFGLYPIPEKSRWFEYGDGWKEISGSPELLSEVVKGLVSLGSIG